MRRRTILLAVGSVVLVGLVAAYVLQQRVIGWALKPHGRFDAKGAPPAPDYARPESWAARPEVTDYADVAPPGLHDEQAAAPADVFFIHPTTYFTATGWNAAYDEGGRTREVLENGVLRHQASAFNGCCRVYAPRYRQAALYSFMTEEKDGMAALDLAYSDVRRAFEHFITVDSPSRPFILAAHSQGSAHALRLLQERIAGTPLASRLVAAYVIGYMLPRELFRGDVRVCESPTQTGCVIGWRTYQDGIEVERKWPPVWLNGAYVPSEPLESVCVNPLTWSAAAATAAQNPGSLAMTRKLESPVAALVPGLVGATCRDGLLRIEEPPDVAFRTRFMGKGNYHVLDYGLFYRSLRDNAVGRVRAFVAQSAAAAPAPAAPAHD